jgi:hypothetical protein
LPHQDPDDRLDEDQLKVRMRIGLAGLGAEQLLWVNGLWSWQQLEAE